MYRGCPKYPWILSTPGSVHCVLVGTVGCTEDVLSIPGYLVHRDQNTVLVGTVGCTEDVLSIPGYLVHNIIYYAKKALFTRESLGFLRTTCVSTGHLCKI